MRATYPAHLILIYMITLIILGEAHKFKIMNHYETKMDD
jgi:hypothetical protein